MGAREARNKEGANRKTLTLHGDPFRNIAMFPAGVRWRMAPWSCINSSNGLEMQGRVGKG